MSGLVEILAEDRITSVDQFPSKLNASYTDYLRYMGDYEPELFKYVRERSTADLDFWIAREFFRIKAYQKSGYRPIDKVVPLPKVDLDHRLLFPHGAIRDALKIAFTPTAEYGRSDRQVVTTLGKFLTKYYADRFSAAEIRDFTTAWRDYHGTDDVMWARTSDEIERVYLNSAVTSCMSHKVEEGCYRTGGIMPVRAYGGGETPVAYLWREGRAVSRTLINEPKKHWLRIFGDDLLRVKLEKLGYTQGSLEGAKILKIPYGGGWVVPYIDGDAQCVREIPNDDKHLMVDCGGYCTSANGFVAEGGEESDMRQCMDCEDEYEDNDMNYSHFHDDYVCRNCIDNNGWTHALSRVEGGVDHDWVRDGVSTYWTGVDEYVTDDHRSFVFRRYEWVALSEEHYSDDNVAAPRSEAVETCNGHMIYDCDAATCANGDVHHSDDVVKIGDVGIYDEDDLSEFYISTVSGAAEIIHEDEVDNDENSVDCIRVHAWLFWMLCFMTKEQVIAVIEARFANNYSAIELFKDALNAQLSENTMLKEGPPQHNLFLEAA